MRLLLLGLVVIIDAYQVGTPRPLRHSPATMSMTDADAMVGRRAALVGAVTAGIAAVLPPPMAALAAQDVTDLTRLRKGLKDITFLLDNWDQETVDPISGADSPDRVRYFLGLRTTDHPLFQVDKLLTKAQDKISDDDFENWVQASESFNSAVAKVNELAYTSSFGEYNPGGGKDQIRKYLLLAKDEVIVAKRSLETMVKLLNV